MSQLDLSLREVINHAPNRSRFLIMGDSLIKNIDSQKVTKKIVHRRMYPGKHDQPCHICHELNSIHIGVEPSRVIIHSGTNKLPSDSVGSCVSKTENLASK